MDTSSFIHLPIHLEKHSVSVHSFDERCTVTAEREMMGQGADGPSFILEPGKEQLSTCHDCDDSQNEAT